MIAFAPLLALALHAAATPPLVTPRFDRMAKEAREILAELVAVDTTNPPGNEAQAVALLAHRLQKAGIAHEVTTFESGRDNLVARVRGDGTRKPLLLLAHLDVVGTQGQRWSVPAHALTEKGGYLYGRGVGDDLGMAAVDLALALELSRSQATLHRDLIVAFTGDEESGGAGMRWLLAHKPESIDAEVAFNEGGGPLLRDDGQIELIELQTAEKIYQDFSMTSVGTTGHSSVPLPDNAILALSRALLALASEPFPDRLIPVTRAYFAGRAPFEPGALGVAMAKIASADGPLPADALAAVRERPSLDVQLHTTCVATLVSGGTRVNALPASAEANVNCRILPDETIGSVQARLQRLAGTQATLTAVRDFGGSAPAPLDGPGPAAVLAASRALYPGVTMVPIMSAGADDSRFLRQAGIRAYGFAPLALTEADSRRAHGIDERIAVSSLRSGVELFYDLVQALNR